MRLLFFSNYNNHKILLVIIPKSVLAEPRRRPAVVAEESGPLAVVIALHSTLIPSNIHK